MNQSGYYRFPTICDDQVVFVSEDDLWTVAASGGAARRVTSGRGAASFPALSPNGRWLAFSGREEGHTEVYVMPAQGGEARRLTFLGAEALVVGWTPDGQIVFTSNAAQPFPRLFQLHVLPPQGGQPEPLPLGPAMSLSFGPGGGRVLGRHQMDPARWKRYRGGTAGDLWIDPEGAGRFHRLIQLPGNLTRPLWLGERVFFLSDHEGIGNLYSCTPDGEDLTRHTHHEDFYVRHPSSDGRRIVYHAGADLYLYDPQADASRQIEVDYHSPRTQRQRKFVQAGKYLEDYALHPRGHLLALTARGKAFTLGPWEGPVLHHGEPDGVRYRLARWLPDGERLVWIGDAEGEEALEIHARDGRQAPRRLAGLDLGRALELKPAPKADRVALSNHRNELILVDLEAETLQVLDRSAHAPIAGFNWSPDGRWLAYSWAGSEHTAVIKLCQVDTGQITPLTTPVLQDVQPVFDPEGKYLYFLSYREFNPVYDQLHFDLGFPRGVRPYLITLQRDLTSPFLPEPKPADEKPEAEKEEKAEPKEIQIDLEGIEQRVLAFPVPEGRYRQIEAIPGKVLWATLPIEGALDGASWPPGGPPPAKATLEAFDFESQKAETLVNGITSFKLSADGKTLAYRAGNRLRVIKAGQKPDEKTAHEPPGKKSRWVDLDRLKVSVRPPLEWRQIVREAWRLQRDHFWDESMSQVDWQAVYARYLPLVDRVSTRGELSDLLWEMQGELGTSHAYEFGGDYREEPRYTLGFLGADFAFDEAAGLWRLKHIVRGDPWDDQCGSPLLKPGVNAQPGETLLAVNGRRLSREFGPTQALVNQAGQTVALTLADAAGEGPRTVSVKTLSSETPARYREWVERNRALVHERTDGRVGYVHIPNMMAAGYAEFHRAFLAEVDREGLIIDVRFNGGGHVSGLLLEKLARRRLAYVKTRWFGAQPYPEDSPAGPLVALTNEYAGSDGDIFSHGFKLLGLGPLIGKRTWGGVIGIWPRHPLADGGLTTQPEFSFWFVDVGWRVENHGTEPDIEVEHRPQDYAAGRDPQLERALKEVSRLLQTQPPSRPQFEPLPSRKLPKLSS